LTAVFFYDKYIKIVQRDKIGEKMRAGRHQHKNEIPIPNKKMENAIMTPILINMFPMLKPFMLYVKKKL